MSGSVQAGRRHLGRRTALGVGCGGEAEKRGSVLRGCGRREHTGQGDGLSSRTVAWGAGEGGDLRSLRAGRAFSGAAGPGRGRSQAARAATGRVGRRGPARQRLRGGPGTERGWRGRRGEEGPGGGKADTRTGGTGSAVPGGAWGREGGGRERRGGSLAVRGRGRGGTGRAGAAHQGSGLARGGGRAGQDVPRPEAPQARGSMPRTAAPEVASTGDSGGGGHRGLGRLRSL